MPNFNNNNNNNNDDDPNNYLYYFYNDNDLLTHYLSDDDGQLLYLDLTTSLTTNYAHGPLGPFTIHNFDTHQTICVSIMKFTGALSMLSSYLIIRDIVIRYYQRERIRLTSKVIFELSIGDFFGSFFSAVMGTWMVPRESGAYLASSGTRGSCTAQGVLVAFFYGIAITMNAVLAMTYYYLVKMDCGDGARTKRSVRLILGVPLLIPIILSVLPLVYDGYNYTDIGVCGVGEFPLGCLVIDDDELFPEGCTRGTKAMPMKFIQLSFILLINLTIDASVVLMIWHAWSRDRRMNHLMSLRGGDNNVAVMNDGGVKSSSSSGNDDTISNSVRRKQIKKKSATSKFVWQGIWYVASFQISWFPWYVWQWVRITDDGHNPLTPFESVALLYILSITHPSQGYLNALVYFRPSYLKYRQRDANEFRLASVCRVLNITVPRILLVEWWKSILCCRRKESDEENVAKEEEVIEDSKSGKGTPQDIGSD